MLLQKLCIRCKKVQSIEEFYKSKKGLWRYCKTCDRKRCCDYRHSEKGKKKIREYRESESGQAVARRYRKIRFDSGETQAYHKKWRNTSKGKKSCHKSGKKQRELHPERNRTRMVSKAVNRGALIRPDSCSLCSKKCKPEGHHDDYSKILDVIWVCSLCHKGIHKAKREALAKI